jgi:hypothetical protein
MDPLITIKSIRGIHVIYKRIIYRIYEGMYVMYEEIHEILSKYIRGSIQSIGRIYKGIHEIYVGNLQGDP